MTTKKQERDALAKIRQIVDRLGAESYIGTAFKGVLEDADTNIEWDTAFSKADELAIAKEEIEAMKQKDIEIASLSARVQRLEAELEREHEWKPYDSDLNVKQADYEAMANAGSTMEFTDDEAKRFIASEFGFDPSRVTILRSVYKEEIDRHRRCRRVGEIERKPCYNATDWNYIRFDCANWFYKVHNGELRKFYC